MKHFRQVGIETDSYLKNELSGDEENIQWGPPEIKFILDRWVDALLPKSIILVAACVSYTEARLNILWGGRCNLMAHKNA